MRKVYQAFAFWGALLFATGAFAQDEARAIVEKAIQAQGGEANVAKLRTMRIKVEGTAALIPGQPDLPFTIEDTWQMPTRYKTTSTFQLTGRKLIQTQVIDGDRGWIRIDGQTQDLPKEAITEMSEQKYAEDLDRLAFLKGRGIQLSALDEIKVDGRPAVGIIVKSAGHRDVKLYFDVASGLLVKREHRVLDPSSGAEVRQEVVFGDYQTKDGLKHYKKITAYRDGQKVLEAKVTEIEFFKNLDEKMFARP
jgi:hypothetical protein